MKSQNIWTENICSDSHEERNKEKKEMDSFGWSCGGIYYTALNSCIVQVVNISLGKLAFFQPPLKLITSLVATHAPLQPARAIYFRRWPRAPTTGYHNPIFR